MLIIVVNKTTKRYNVIMSKEFPISIKFENKERQELQKMADELGMPLSIFVKVVLRQSAEQIYQAVKSVHVTNDVNSHDIR